MRGFDSRIIVVRKDGSPGRVRQRRLMEFRSESKALYSVFERSGYRFASI